MRIVEGQHTHGGMFIIHLCNNNIFQWLRQNKIKFYHERSTGIDVLLINNTIDAMAFKLKWL